MRAPPLPFLLLALVLLGATRAAAPSPARADFEETERRLKAVGVDDALRLDIHRAIDRAVAWFAAKQISDGSFLDPGTWAGGWGSRTALTTISALAVRHAGTPASRDVTDRAMRFLFVRQKARDEVVNFVYTAGLASMLLMADGAYPKVHETIGKGLASAIDARTGWFGYCGRLDGFVVPTADFVHLSSTQFAVLGLWAAARRGFGPPRDLWVRHAKGLVATQTKTGSWAYVPSPAAAGYSTGTFMGLANLLLCEKHLGDLAGDPDLAKRLLAAKTLGLGALRRDAAAVLRSLAEGRDGAGATRASAGATTGSTRSRRPPSSRGSSGSATSAGTSRARAACSRCRRRTAAGASAHTARTGRASPRGATSSPPRSRSSSSCAPPRSTGPRTPSPIDRPKDRPVTPTPQAPSDPRMPPPAPPPAPGTPPPPPNDPPK